MSRSPMLENGGTLRLCKGAYKHPICRDAETTGLLDKACWNIYSYLTNVLVSRANSLAVQRKARSLQA